MTTAFRHSVVPQVAAFKANISAGSILVSTLSKGAKTRNGGRVVVDGLVALDKIAACIRGDSKTLSAKTAALRAMLQAEGRKGRYETDKLLMPAIMPAAQAPSGTAIKGLSLGHHNDLYGFDVDEQREGMDLAAVRQDLIAAPGAVMVGTSCAGDALFAIFAGPRAETDDEYKRHWTAIAAAMPESARANNSRASKNFNRLRFLAHDPDVWLAETVTPLAGALELAAQPQGVTPEITPSPAPVDLGDQGDVDGALAWVMPPDDYNEWLGWLGTLKAVGLSVGDVEAWAALGSKHKPGDVEQRWAGLPDDNPDDARRKLIGHAHNLGWRRTPRLARVSPEGVKAALTPSPARVAAPDSCDSPPPSNEWLSFGEWWNKRYGRGCWVYSNDPAALGWWHYVGNVWRPLLSTDPRLLDLLARYRYRFAHELAAEGQRDLAAMLGESTGGLSFSGQVKQGAHADMWVGLRHACSGPIPTPEPHVVGVPSGVVDLRDGSLRPHAPEYGIRALTAGDFSHDVEAHKRALTVRLGRVFDDENMAAYIKLAGLSLTGLAQSYRAIVIVVGDSGSGKGGAVNVLVRAFGGRAMGVGNEWLAQRERSEIDAIAADILERQPAVLSVDEVGGDTAVGQSRMLSLTGNTIWSYRRPHGTLLSGSPAFQLWTTAVKPPALDSHSGIARRLAVLHTLRPLGESEVDEIGGKAPELLNAIVSLACKQAAGVYAHDYRAPEGSRAAKAETLADMDQVAAWLEEQDDLDGVLVKDARERACKALDSWELTSQRLGIKLSKSTMWAPDKGAHGVRKIVRRQEEFVGMAGG